MQVPSEPFKVADSSKIGDTRRRKHLRDYRAAGPILSRYRPFFIRNPPGFGYVPEQKAPIMD